MACLWCPHFKRHYESTQGLDGEAYLQAKGNCTLNPKHVEVGGDHWCSHWAGDFSILGRWWLERREELEEQTAIRARAVAAEAKAKELRRKLREAKGT